MFKKQDHDFFEMLDDPAKVEKRLAELASQRLWLAIGAVIQTLTVFFVVFTLLSAIIRADSHANQPTTPITAPVSATLAMVASLAITLARTQGAHNEIRTLLTFKKLRDIHPNG